MPLALITGASSGIGESTAKIFDKAGIATILLARREDRLRDIAKDLKHCVGVFVLDVSCKNACEEFVQKNAELLSNLDILVNNAGLAKGIEKVDQAKLEDWEQMIATNINGLLYMTRLLLPQLKKNEGHVVNVGSVAGRWVYPGGAVYCATKYAVRAFTEGLRMDLLGSRVRATLIDPGRTETEFSLVRLENSEKAKKVYEGYTPLSAKDVGETILWAVQRPKHVNVQEIVLFPTDQASVEHIHYQTKL